MTLLSSYTVTNLLERNMFINNVEFKIGADPEVFVKNKQGLVSGFGMIPGDKQNPHPVELGAVQVDGMALEFNIDPVRNATEWERNITTVMRNLKAMIPDDHNLVVTPTAEFGKDYIKAQPEEAQMLGCDPDMNAYTGDVNPAPDGDVGFRTGAGHIHIGWGENIDVNDPNHKDACIRLIKNMDKFVGVPSLLYDRDGKRRQLYGKAGAFRIKPYGVEYRTLSNKWLKNKALRRLVFKSTKRAIVESFKERQSTGDRFQNIINGNDVGLS